MDSPLNVDGSVFSSSLLPTPAQSAQLLQLLRCNSLLTHSESEELEAVIASALVDIARYDVEIGQSPGAMDRMVSERVVLQEYVDKCRSAFSPVRRLPPEILAHIFAFCSPDLIPLYEPQQSLPLDPLARTAQLHLLRLSRVCFGWREIVMGTPWLWTTIEGDFTDPLIIERGIALLSQSLQRSARCSLAIHLAAWDDTPGLELLAQHSQRWQSADIFMYRMDAKFLSGIKGNLPLLEHLDLNLGRNEEIGPIDMFEFAPKLTRVALVAGGAVPRLPWSQLREVTLHSNFVDQDRVFVALAIMPQCSNECAFRLCGLDATEWILPIPEFGSVTSDIWSLDLTLKDESSSDHCREALGALLARCTFPCFRSLRFRSRRQDPPLHWPRNDFAAFASRSSLRERLTTLHLHDMVITEDEFIECLSEMHALSHLFMQDVPRWLADDTDHVETDHVDTNHILITDSLLRRLTWTPDTARLGPHLASLHVATLFTFDHHALLDLITSRIVSGSRDGPFEVGLEWMDREPLIADSVLSRVRELQSQGKLRWRLECRTD
ncbi:F-box domain-containing protein [Mycena venus]|uniref:F-box domain-containing protein n=1 Tax=Mycena venus TaxID=2733690 RepID=A0A8H6YKL0_9AGAR|nr:F-box domain-containing protein [Mycena venus]